MLHGCPILGVSDDSVVGLLAVTLDPNMGRSHPSGTKPGKRGLPQFINPVPPRPLTVLSLGMLASESWLVCRVFSEHSKKRN